MRLIVFIFVIVAILALLFGLVVGLDSLTCHNQTADIGYPSRFLVLGGCQIEVNPGQWIPLSSYYFKQGPGGMAPHLPRLTRAAFRYPVIPRFFRINHTVTLTRNQWPR